MRIPLIQPWRTWALLLMLLFLGGLAQGQVLPIPALTGRVIDQTQTLSAAEQAELETRLAQFEQEAGSQLVILMVPTTAPEDIAAYAFRVADDWKIGRPGVGDGLLLLVAKDDRATRIEVSRALEGAVPDLMASRIIEESLLPQFRQGFYAEGLNDALSALFMLVRGEQLPAPAASEGTPNVNGEVLATFGLVILIAGRLLTLLLGRTRGALATGGIGGLVAFLLTYSLVVTGIAAAIGAVAALFLHNLPLGEDSGGGGGGGGGFSSGGGSFSSGGGGGFSSGGGGSFGGGGASGRW